MLKESRKVKRELEDDAEYQRKKWIEYERRKSGLPPMRPEQYEQSTRQILRELNL